MTDIEWFSPASLLGYVGTTTNLVAAGILAYRQKTNAWLWGLIWCGNILWVTAGLIMGQPAVVLDVLVFVPVHAAGTCRYFLKWRKDEDQQR